MLFERIIALSAPGSWMCSNVPGEGFADPEKVRRHREDMERVRSTAAKLIAVEVTDFDELWYPE